jgi:hypothetical protein
VEARSSEQPPKICCRGDVDLLRRNGLLDDIGGGDGGVGGGDGGTSDNDITVGTTTSVQEMILKIKSTKG